MYADSYPPDFEDFGRDGSHLDTWVFQRIQVFISFPYFTNIFFIVSLNLDRRIRNFILFILFFGIFLHSILWKLILILWNFFYNYNNIFVEKIKLKKY